MLSPGTASPLADVVRVVVGHNQQEWVVPALADKANGHIRVRQVDSVVPIALAIIEAMYGLLSFQVNGDVPLTDVTSVITLLLEDLAQAWEACVVVAFVSERRNRSRSTGLMLVEFAN